MIPLRDRAIDTAILGALLHTRETQPLTVAQIQTTLTFGPHAPALRLEIIKESLNRLIRENKIGPASAAAADETYFIQEATARELDSCVRPIEDLLAKVIERHTRDHAGPPEQAFSVFQTFLSECFARLGSQIAQRVVRGASLDDVISHDEIEKAFQKAILGKLLSQETETSLRIRCFNMLKSPHPEDVQLKFYLTNCYYVTQLLGLEPKQFDPLAEQTFSGSVFYLDTNVLLLGLLSPGGRNHLFEELVRVTRRLGIQLRVTRATIDETRGVAADRIAAIRKLVDLFPDEILERTGDNFVEAFLLAREHDPATSPDEVFLAFDHISEIIPHWEISIEEQTEDTMIAGRDFTCEADMIQQVRIDKKGWPKSPRTLNHDLAHYAFVQDQRKENSKTWFLTRDETLFRAAKILAGDKPAVCFSLLGFLQSLSPFLTPPGTEHSLADVFAKLLTDQIFPTEPLFDVGELLLLAEKNRDVLVTPKDRLIPALEYLKTQVLRGQPYTQSEIPAVSLALGTFMTRDADLREKELIRRVEVASAEAKISKEDADLSRALQSQTLMQLHESSAENEALKAKVEQLISSHEQSQRESIRKRNRRRNLFRTIGILSGLYLWGLRESLWKTVNGRWNLVNSAWQHTAITGCGLAGLVVIVLSLWHLLRHRDAAKQTKILVVSMVVAAIIVSTTFLKPETVSAWAEALQIGGVVGLMLMVWFKDKRDRD
jgi:hypothetical protein